MLPYENLIETESQYGTYETVSWEKAMIALCLFTSTAVFAGNFWDVDFLNYMGIGEEKASKPEMLVNVAVSDSSKEGIQLNVRNVANDGYHLFILLDAEGLSENEKGYHFEEIRFNGDIHGQEYGITSEYIGRKDDMERFIVRLQDFGEGLVGKTCRLELKGLAVKHINQQMEVELQRLRK